MDEEMKVSLGFHYFYENWLLFKVIGMNTVL